MGCSRLSSVSGRVVREEIRKEVSGRDPRVVQKGLKGFTEGTDIRSKLVFRVRTY